MTLVAPSFEHLVDVAKEYRAYARMRRRLRVMYAVAGILIAVAVVCTVVPLLMQYASQTSMSVSASSVEQQVRLWPESRIDDELRAARAYNRDLVRSGQPVLGAQADPFNNGERLSSQSAQDQRYSRLLNEGHGIMGRVSIPKISVDLPIYHGTGDKQLSLGSGHLYGTSLPVGGNNTHAVITGHRGMVQAQMFTRLDEMREGDFIYISTMNRTLAYAVDRNYRNRTDRYLAAAHCSRAGSADIDDLYAIRHQLPPAPGLRPSCEHTRSRPRSDRSA